MFIIFPKGELSDVIKVHQTVINCLNVTMRKMERGQIMSGLKRPFAEVVTRMKLKRDYFQSILVFLKYIMIFRVALIVRIKKEEICD